MGDWLSAAAAESWARLWPTVAPRFSKKQWKTFSNRAEANWEQLFRLLHRLYGWRYDFAWTMQEVLEVIVAGFLQRPPRWGRIDGLANHAWLGEPATLWAMAYLDRYGGSAAGLAERVGHLKSLGVTHLHLLPPYAVPDGPNDGGYAVSDYRRLRPDLGTMEDLRSAIEVLSRQGIGVVLDLVCNHTASDHPWAQAAAADDPAFSDFYLFFPDREVPDQISRDLRAIFPDRGGDAFSWLPESQRWVWATFHTYQWDLNYRNPKVLAAMAGEMLFLANLGVAAIRMDATPFLWKEPATTSENRPEAHLVLQIFRLVADLACPSVVFLSEAIVHPDEVASYVSLAECALAYNPLLMTAVWDALATDDARFLAKALGPRFPLPPGTQWLTYLRSHDDIGWGFADEDAEEMGVDPGLHRLYLNDFYSGRFPGSFARGELFQPNPLTGDARISGSLSSLAGLEAALESQDPAQVEIAVNRIIAAYVVVLFTPGIPLLMLGDEQAALSNHDYRADAALAYDNRWSHRHRFDLEAAAAAEAGEGPGGRVLATLRALLDLRRSLPPLARPEPFPTGDRGTIGFDAGPLRVLVNLSRGPALLDGPVTGFDLFRQDDLPTTILPPYAFRLLANPEFTTVVDPAASPQNG